MTAQKPQQRGVAEKGCLAYDNQKAERVRGGKQDKRHPQRYTLKDQYLPDRVPSPNNTELWSHGSIGEFSCQIHQIPHDPVPSQLERQVGPSLK